MTTNDIPQTLSAPMPDPNDLAAIVRGRGVLIGLEITCWSGRKLDKRVTEETNMREGADTDASRTNKSLLGGKVVSYSACVAAAQAARMTSYKETLPWNDAGDRLLPTSNYFEYTEKIRAARVAFKTAVDAFLAEYPQLVTDAQNRLGSMYDPNDYPPATEVARKFAFKIHFTPVPAGSDIRLDLPPEVTQHMTRSITARVESSVHAAVKDGWTRLYGSVERIRDRLKEIAAGNPDPNAPAGRLHASLFDSAVETAETLKRLNILNDPNLEAMANRVIAEIGALDVKNVRATPDAMNDTAAKADAILATMGSLFK